MRVEGLNRVITKLRQLALRYGNPDASVVVGYSAEYALFVHENLQAHHNVGNAKFLEGPARRLKGRIATIVVEGLRRDLTFVQALLRGGLFLQGESQKEAPVATGYMRASAFTRPET